MKGVDLASLPKGSQERLRVSETLFENCCYKVK